jgi:hypothetical protein
VEWEFVMFDGQMIEAPMGLDGALGMDRRNIRPLFAQIA